MQPTNKNKLAGHIQKKPFTIIFLSIEKFKNQINSWVNNAYGTNRSFFGFKNPLEIELIYTRKKFDSLMPANRPKEMKQWDAGMAVSSNKIFLFSPTVIEKFTKHKKGDLKATLCHEICHAFHLKLIGGAFNDLPLWWIEGLACLVAAQTKIPAKIPNILKMTQLNCCSGDMRYGYAASALFIKFLKTKYGLKKLKNLLRASTLAEFNKLWVDNYSETPRTLFNQFRCKMRTQLS